MPKTSMRESGVSVIEEDGKAARKAEWHAPDKRGGARNKGDRAAEIKKSGARRGDVRENNRAEI